MKIYIHLIISLSVLTFFVACQTTNHIEENPIDSNIQQNANKDEVIDSYELYGETMRSSSISISSVPPIGNGEPVTYAYTLTYPNGQITKHTSNTKVYANTTYGEMVYNSDSNSYEENIYSMSVSISRIPPSTLKMNEDEVVTYTFTYPDGKTTKHTLAKKSDGNIYGEIIYDFDGASYNYVIYENYANVDSYLNETMFLLYGDALSNTVEKEIKVEEMNFDAVPVSPPVDYVGDSCNDSIVNVVAGEFPVEICTRYNEYDNTLVTKYTNGKYFGDSKPLDGLFKYEQVSNGESHTVELTYWNGK